MKYLLGIDSGGTVTKAGLYDVEGREIATAGEPVDIVIPFEGTSERDAEQLKQAMYTVVRKVIEESGVDSKDIIGISPTGSGNGLFLFDENGNAVHNPIMSGDIRANKYVKKWTAEGLVENLFQPRTYQVIWAGQPVAILAWLRDNDPETLKKAKYAVTCKDYMRYLLTGVFLTELTESSGWSLMDTLKEDYDDELFAAAGISEYRHLFPRVIKSSEIGGYVTKEAAEATGLAEGTPVMGGMFDITACPLGTGMSDSSRLSIVAGTWSINGYIDKKPSKEIMMTTHYFTPGYFLISENSATSATNLEWFINRFMQSEKAEAKSKGLSIYDTINEMVASVDTRECPIIFVPFLFGSNASIDAKSLFIGLSGIHTKAHMLRAVYEGIVFSHLYHFEKLYKTKPKSTFEAVRISGGVTKSELWTQMFADIIGLPMEVSRAAELGILGSCMCAGIGAGYFKDADDAAKVFVSIEKAVEPRAEMNAFYQKKYSLYKKILDSLDAVWPDFDGLTAGSL